MDDILHAGRRESVREPKKVQPIERCGCGSRKMADLFDNRYPSRRFCPACFASGLDKITFSDEEDTRRLYAKRQLPNGDVVEVRYTPRSIEEMCRAHGYTRASEEEPLRV